MLYGQLKTRALVYMNIARHTHEKLLKKERHIHIVNVRIPHSTEEARDRAVSSTGDRGTEWKDVTLLSFSTI